MPKIIDDVEQFRLLGKLLEGNIASEIRDAKDRGWEPQLVAGIRDAAEKYIKMASRFARYLGVSAFIPLVVVVAKVFVQNQPDSGFGVSYAAWVSLVGMFAMWLFFPLFVIIPPLRKLPESDYRELLRPLWMNLEVFYILISAGLFAYIYPSWNFSTTLPIWALIVLLWLFAPWAMYLAKLDGIFIKLRFAQLGLLITGTLLIVASPVPMTQYQWWTQREVANKIRPVEQKEITANWETLQWFSQEGTPNVWYSGDRDTNKYRLFYAPGYDPETNEKLKPVKDEATKTELVTWLRKQKAAQEAQLELLKQERLTEEKAQAEHRETERQQQVAADATLLIREYVFPHAIGASLKERSTALIVLDDSSKHDPALAKRISNVFNQGGLPTDTAVFTPGFISSPFFGDMLAGNLAPKLQFQPENFATNLLIVRLAAATSKQAPVKDVEMVATDVVCLVQLISLTERRLLHSSEVRSRGVGFNEAGARKNALERIEGELTNGIAAFTAKLSSPK